MDLSHLIRRALIPALAVSFTYACALAPDAETLTNNTRPNALPPPVSSAAPPTKTDAAPLPAPPPSHGDPPPTLPVTAFASAKTCGDCHDTIYQQWSTSMHSRSLVSPLMISETNQGVRGPYAAVPNPDPKRLCVNCHSPSAARVTKEATLPLGDDSTLWKEGISCETCHQFNGTAASGGAGYSSAYMAGLSPGSVMFGPLDNPATTSAHGTGHTDAFDRPNTMCGNCHNVNFDNNHDGRIEKGPDLVLQQTWDEYVSDYKAIGGTETCISCHMPVMAGLKQVVDGASNPQRDVHDHSFVGVDYALDDVAQRDATRAARTALLQGAAKLTVDPTTLAFDGTNVSLQVTVTNSGAGHNLPTGFAFVRQMWLEVTVLDAGGAVLASSGVLATPSDDLCESEVLADTQNPLSTLVTGCPGGTADPALVHFQLKLVDSVEIAPDAQGNPVKDQLGQPLLRGAAASREVLLQLLPGGVIARKRPADGTALPTLRPFESRTLPYKLPTGGATPASVAVRLLFRNAPPYFVRGLAAAQPLDVPNLGALVQNLEIVEMAKTTASLAN